MGEMEIRVMRFLKIKPLWTVALGIALIIALFATSSTPANASDYEEQPSGYSPKLTCETVSATISGLPLEQTEIVINSNASGQFWTSRYITGGSGSVSASWSEIGVDTSQGGMHTVRFSWTGGAFGPFNYDASECATYEEPDNYVLASEATCVPNSVTGAAEYFLVNTQTSGPAVIFDPPTGTPLPNGSPITVRWQSESQYGFITSTSAVDCTQTPSTTTTTTTVAVTTPPTPSTIPSEPSSSTSTTTSTTAPPANTVNTFPDIPAKTKSTL